MTEIRWFGKLGRWYYFSAEKKPEGSDMKNGYQRLYARRAIFSVLLFGCLFWHGLDSYAQECSPAGNKLKTAWTDKANPSAPLPEYPRPMLQRSDWMNLNGSWNFTILPKGNPVPDVFPGKILVPFPVESSLSGVQKAVGPDHEVWYSRTFAVPVNWKNKKILLHFGAVDWKADVWINGIKAGNHKGGYTPFCLDISPYLIREAQQSVIVRVWDPADKGFQPRGKQVSEPRGIWYTSVTGIWQTVWLEPVGETYITQVKTIPDIDQNSVSITVNTTPCNDPVIAEVRIIDGNKVVSSGKAVAGQEVLLGVPDAKLWSPDSPFLYDLVIILYQQGNVIDKAGSYFGMRKISTKKDSLGVVRIQLNNRNCFPFGLLDQGWWPDGLYTAPTDEALKSDIIKTRDLGYNLIRKHVKVEPARWYYHCDREGILVWQDMPSGDRGPQWQDRNYFTGQEHVRSPESEANYRAEWKSIIDLLISHPSVISWIPFNESWGQFKTVEIAEWTKSYDPSRLVNPASGGNFYPTGDILDVHHYPDPEMTLYDGSRATVLGEFGGLGLVVNDHVWVKDRNWGYVQYKSTEEVTSAYIDLAQKLKKLIKSGFSAAIYTQTTDVEIEVNGLMTYDRKIIKMDAEKIRKVNLEICNSLQQP